MELQQKIVHFFVAIPTRLFISKADKINADEKRRKLRRYYQRHGRKPSKKNLKCCDFTFHISNVSKQDLSKDNAQKMYSLRWQIEIQFKTWKSFMNIDKVSYMNQHRFECHHYGSLIFILLTSKILQACKHVYWETEQVELSELKAMKFLAI